jgi:hypothetical protein
MDPAAALPPPSAYVETLVTAKAEAGADRPARFVIARGAKSDADFENYSAIVSNALRAKGYTPVDDANTADLVVSLGYSTNRYLPMIPYSPAPNDQVSGEAVGRDGKAYSVTRAVPNQTGAPTFAEEAGFKRRIRIEARYRRSAGEQAPAWRADLVSTGPEADMRTVFPTMIASGADLFGAEGKATRTEGSPATLVTLASR